MSSQPLSFWRTVFLLLRTSRRRADGRRQRAYELLQQRKKGSTDWSALSSVFAIVMMLVLNGMAAAVVYLTVGTGQQVQAESHGQIIVSRWFLDDVKFVEKWSAERGLDPRRYFTDRDTFTSEADRIADRQNAKKPDIERRLRDAAIAHGSQAFVTRDEVAPGITGLSRSPIGALVGSVVLLWWMIMLAFQGEGLELDLQRRRHPMWECRQSHVLGRTAVRRHSLRICLRS
jgi:hypothetical protein